jgi:LysM repeat protein
MRKWTMSACVVLAWSVVLLILAALGSVGAARPAQANTSIASYPQATLASESVAVRTANTAAPAARPATWTVQPGDTLSSIAAGLAVPGGWQAVYTANRQAIGPDPNLIRPGITLILPGSDKPARYTVAAGDTLSGIAAVLAVPGGWQALYAANRQAIGPDPDVIRPGTVLVTLRPTAPVAGSQTPRQESPAPTRPSRQATPTHETPGQIPASNRLTPKAGATAPARGMPRWLEDVLLAAGLLGATAFATEPFASFVRRRRAARHASPHLPARKPNTVECAVTRARIILADHERLIVTYSIQDDTVYVLTPPGEDPQAVLRAARLVLPEDTYEDLADHLGVPSAWPLE